MAKVVHFEIPADNVDRAKNFYGSVLAGSFRQCPWGRASTRV